MSPPKYKPLYCADDATRVVPLARSPEQPEAYRTSWRRDYARILHSAAFRRLQGKTQLFPGHESDFFRNRLTHSLEVAQIAKSLAIRLNASEQQLATQKVDLDLVEAAALAHDLGHPPFGHNGEEVLDELMRDHGGFEGNAQTLRIIAKLEKRQTLGDADDDVVAVCDGEDRRAGLNLAYRTLAAVLKYDRQIPPDKWQRASDERDGPVKGYYQTEADLVQALKRSLGLVTGQPLRTIECSIMDVADDIAYSTYDLEDSFKGGFLTPLSMLSASENVLMKVADTVQRRLRKSYDDTDTNGRTFDSSDVLTVLLDIFGRLFDDAREYLPGSGGPEMDPVARVAGIAQSAAALSTSLASDGYLRTRLTSDLVGRFVRGVRFVPHATNPALSTVQMDRATFLQVEVLKNFTFQSMVMSPMLTVTKYRGKEIVRTIFTALADGEGFMLMPDDYRAIYMGLTNPSERKRVICDFIAGMTDRYAIEFYSRLRGTDPGSIYSPI